MADCNNLTVYYDIGNADKAVITDLISLSTPNVIRRSIVKVDFLLYNKSGEKIGDIFIIDNLTTYKNTPDITQTMGEYVFVINNCGFIEKYSVLLSSSSVRNSEGKIIASETKFLNLTSVEGKASYSKLRWIFPADKDGIPLTRTLTFYN